MELEILHSEISQDCITHDNYLTPMNNDYIILNFNKYGWRALDPYRSYFPITLNC